MPTSIIEEKGTGTGSGVNVSIYIAGKKYLYIVSAVNETSSNDIKVILRRKDEAKQIPLIPRSSLSAPNGLVFYEATWGGRIPLDGDWEILGSFINETAADSLKLRVLVSDE